MGRKNIFEILAEKEDIAYQLDRIETLLSKHSYRWMDVGRDY